MLDKSTESLFILQPSNIETAATETANLIGNPYADIRQFGFQLQKCNISFRGKNGRGHNVTGRFLLDGCWQTSGGCSYEELILFVARKATERRNYYDNLHRERESYKKENHI